MLERYQTYDSLFRGDTPSLLKEGKLPPSSGGAFKSRGRKRRSSHATDAKRTMSELFGFFEAYIILIVLLLLGMEGVSISVVSFCEYALQYFNIRYNSLCFQIIMTAQFIF